ncbi:MAG: energy transducer TonB [Ignavibacteriaceae bacterium]|jgi:protein TonB|nr:energy transducer TonB [Ignavibacteriaceae bacterium]MCW8812852.1 energy transducer TonB [Chlorobium sp.]MCW8996694.1 energy transducer TonB [Psychromonas sp.]MCW8817936.1 energy transducer TonB [Ignavibacteriaceae bacterium]MCW8824102.1 energy transducer TonB [Ignavibacteriaceae bacterium]
MKLKNPDSDLRAKYKKTFEISLIIALALMIVAFKFFPTFEQKEVKLEGPQELFTVEDIQQTKQENRPPPPPKPPIPIEAPSEDVLEDIELGETELDVNAQMEAPPPPKEEKKVEEEPTYFVAVEEMPDPIGGIKGIQEKIVYPEIAKRAGVEGKVYILAFVDETGTVTKAQVLKGIGAGCDEAALDAVQKTKFKPGKQRGKPVKVQVSIPIIFKLQ